MGTADELASRLRAWRQLRFEITEEPTPGSDGRRYAYTPSLGLFSSQMGVHGDILIHEQSLRRELERAGDGGSLATAMSRLLGEPWDDELDAFRYAGEHVPVRWLHQVG